MMRICGCFVVFALFFWQALVASEIGWRAVFMFGATTWFTIFFIKLEEWTNQKRE